MCMDVLYAHLRSQMTDEYVVLAPLFEAWSLELASRTQILMDVSDLARSRQRMLGKWQRRWPLNLNSGSLTVC